MDSTYLKDLSNVDWLARFEILFKNLTAPFLEVFHGIRAKTIPLIPTLSVAFFLQFMILLHADRLLFLRVGFIKLYPKNTWLFLGYYVFIVGLGFWIWGVIQVGIKRNLARKLTGIFQGCGLQNNLGKFPQFIFDRSLDSATRKLRVTRAILPMESFYKAKDALNGALQIFIDEMRENRIEGTVDIIYSHIPMPNIFRIPSIKSIGKNKFLVGTTRSKLIFSDLDTCPHLLIAGQTGKGKSTFLRQLIASLFLNDRTARFTLIDLKGGLEFQLFERLKRVEVPPTIKKALMAIEGLSSIVDSRMELLKANHCKDITAYLAMVSNTKNTAEFERDQEKLHRHIVVVDEAAEMFLAGSHASAQDIQTAKKVLSKIARQGRSLGVHLVVATQRPDSKALDPQVKANLSGVVCFQMANDASSITVLGNGRATDLPAAPGRGIWKLGGEMFEVQTPLLETSEVEKLLENDYQEPPPAPSAITQEQSPPINEVSWEDGVEE